MTEILEDLPSGLATTAQRAASDVRTDLPVRLARSVAGRIAERLHLPFGRDVRALLCRHELQESAIWRNPPLCAEGLPVVLVGGMTATPTILSALEGWLRRLGCETVIASTGYGVGCGERGAQAVAAAVQALADAAGAPPVVIAHSRGGQFARVAAVRHPDSIRALITLGSPLTRLTAVHPLLLMEIYALGSAGTLGVPGLFRFSCLWGDCCRRLRAEMTGAFPENVRFLSVYSPDDEVVDWRASQDPAARHGEVRASHSGLISDARVFAFLAAELNEILGGKPIRPYDRDEVSRRPGRKAIEETEPLVQMAG